MGATNPNPDVDRFIRDEIDSVPHLEALLLLWNNRPRPYSVDDMATVLFVHPEVAAKILADLTQRELISLDPERTAHYYYDSTAKFQELLPRVDATYRRELVRISGMIHSKASAAVRDFARAFRFTKDRN